MKRFVEYIKTRLRVQHVVQESPPSFLKDCSTKVCIERKPLRWGKQRFKPIFHKKTGLRRVEFASPNTWNVHAQRKDPTPGTQRNLYSTGNGVCVCYPTRRNLHTKNEMYMADARNLRQLTQNIPTCWYILRWVTRNTGIGCTAQRQPPTPGILRSGGI